MFFLKVIKFAKMTPIQVTVIFLITWVAFFLAGNSVYANEDKKDNPKPIGIRVSGQMFGLLPFLQAGGSIGYELSDNLILEASYIKTAQVMSPSKAELATIGIKKFWFDSSFYTNTHFGLLNSHYGFKRAKDSYYTDYEYTNGRAFIVGAGLGNRWQWKNGFFFGVNWLSVSKNMKTISVESKPNETKELKGNQQEPEGPGGSATLLSPHIGFRF